MTFTEVGYTGGSAPNATYELVCRGGTGHAEAVLLHYAPAVVSLSQILEVFWAIHSASYPQMFRDGQYRSAIFYFSEEQRLEAEATKQKLEKLHNKPLYTEITQAGDYWRAEEYHQNYNKKRYSDLANPTTCRLPLP